MQIICGIYSIENMQTHHRYIGSSKHIFKRWDWHKYNLKHMSHTNDYLQKAYNKYGENAFSYNIIQECNTSISDEELETLEESHMIRFQSLDRRFGYNIEHAERHTRSLETREKIGRANRHRKLSIEQRRQRSDAMKKTMALR